MHFALIVRRNLDFCFKEKTYFDEAEILEIQTDINSKNVNNSKAALSVYALRSTYFIRFS